MNAGKSDVQVAGQTGVDPAWLIAERRKRLRAARLCIAAVIAGLVISGVTAFPLESELRGMVGLLRTPLLRPFAEPTHLLAWFDQVERALEQTNRDFPFLAYGTDWLAFAHLAIAVAFLGPYLDPIRNRWVVSFGLIACLGVLPLALIAGPLRGIPLGWRLVDCSFGVIGAVPLLLCRRYTAALERLGSAG
jgi:hypothetical protein